jgi:tetratricopeptide (TPR) repeat protein
MNKLPFILFVLIIGSISLDAQKNCNVYKYRGDDTCYTACKTAIEAEDYIEGSQASQILLSRSIDQCNNMDYAYYKKSIPFLKTGDFVEWRLLIDQAVKINPAVYLGYRAYCRFNFLRDIDGALSDINQLDDMYNGDIGYAESGIYHLNVIKALCYKEKGQTTKAIKQMTAQLNTVNYVPGYYDYLHLGVMKLEAQDFPGAERTLQKQIEHNDYIAETYFFLALAKQGLGKNYESLNLLETALEKYKKGERRYSPYTTPIDKIYLIDIENELARIGSLSGR